MQRMSEHFDVWVTCTGNILVMNHTISSMDAFPRGGVGGRSFRSVGKVCNTRQPPMAASLIAHRTSDTEKNNSFKNFGNAKRSIKQPIRTCAHSTVDNNILPFSLRRKI